MVQLRLRKTHSFVGARSSCSMGGPRNVSISVSLRPIRRSTPCVPTWAASGAGAVVASVAGATALRTGAGRGGASGAGSASAALAWSELLGRNSAGGAESTQPATSIMLTTPMRCRPLPPFMPLPPPASLGLGARCARAWHDNFTTTLQSLVCFPATVAHGGRVGAVHPRQGFAMTASPRNIQSEFGPIEARRHICTEF